MTTRTLRRLFGAQKPNPRCVGVLQTTCTTTQPVSSWYHHLPPYGQITRAGSLFRLKSNTPIVGTQCTCQAPGRASKESLTAISEFPVPSVTRFTVSRFISLTLQRSKINKPKENEITSLFLQTWRILQMLSHFKATEEMVKKGQSGGASISGLTEGTQRPTARLP